MTQQNNTTQINLSILRDLMNDSYSLHELSELCMDLGIDYGNVSGGDIKINKIMGIIEHMQHLDRLPELVSYLEAQRTTKNWHSIYQETKEENGHPPDKKRDKKAKLWPIGVIALAVIVVIAGVFWTITSGQTCPYRGEDDYAAIVQIIRAESQAVNEGNLEIIKDIFAPDAYIKQIETVASETNIKEWFDPMAHYSTLFEATKFSGALHTDIEGSVTGDYARFTSGSKGSYVTGDYYGEYDNKAGNPNEEEVWTFKKNVYGCWQITQFEFH